MTEERPLSQVVDDMRAASRNDFGGTKLTDEQIADERDKARRARLDKMTTEDPRKRQVEAERFSTARRAILAAVDVLPTGRPISAAVVKGTADDVIKAVGGGAAAQASIRDLIEKAALHVSEGEKGAALQLAEESVPGILNADTTVGAVQVEEDDLDSLSPRELADRIRR
jgi:hypothetical protein